MVIYSSNDKHAVLCQPLRLNKENLQVANEKTLEKKVARVLDNPAIR